MSDTVDFFIHIPKTAGTTMAQVIESQYPAGAVLNFREPTITDEDRVRMVTQMSPKILIVAGHLNYSYGKLFPRPSRPFTMLRDPTDRVISLYYYIGRETRHPSHEAFKRGEIKIENLAKRQGRAQACFIAGYTAKDPIPDEELLAEAKDVLQNRMLAVGLTERFDESLLLYNQALGWKVRSYVSVNVTSNRPKKDRMAAGDLAIIRENNFVDQSLYDLTCAMFEKRIAEQPPSFAEELASLRRNVTVAHGMSWVRSGIGRVKRALGLKT
jgi:hypothetical protein